MVVHARTHPAQLTSENRTNREEDGRGARGRSRTSRNEGHSSPQAHLGSLPSGPTLPLPYCQWLFSQLRIKRIL